MYVCVCWRICVNVFLYGSVKSYVPQGSLCGEDGLNVLTRVPCGRAWSHALEFGVLGIGFGLVVRFIVYS